MVLEGSSYRYYVLFLLFLTILLSPDFARAGEDYYELLGIKRDADNREIRRAFKKIAVSKHPDKNKDDPNAHDNFLKISRAYEVLKDAELRKKYDTYGEDGLKNDHPSNQYQSWSFYKEEFGLYDEDKEIITLSKTDFAQSVEGSDDTWFINFYSPHCSHCHDLAPTWREVAHELEGVVRIGAVNCGDDWALCHEQGVQGYPSLLMFPSRQRHQGSRSTQHLVQYALKFVKATVLKLTSQNFDKETKDSRKQDLPWMITFCGDGGDCLESKTCLKLATMLHELITVATVDCHKQEKLCTKLGNEHGTYFFEAGKIAAQKGVAIESLDTREIAFNILEKLPDMVLMDAKAFKQARIALRERLGKPWLLHFTESDSHDLELRKLPAMLYNHKLNVGRVDCRVLRTECNKLHVHKFPTFALFKKGGGHEIHHGRQTAHDIAIFARDSAVTPVEVLTPDDFPERVVNSQDNWFVDFYAPWCPPCMKLLPEFRKASKEPEIKTKFGTVDCTIHASLCQNYNIRSYPTTIFYNGTNPHHFKGRHSSRSIIEFIKDTLNPPMVILTPDTFPHLVEKKGKSIIWVIDYFAPWCGPCQQLAPHWRRLAKMFHSSKIVRIGQVDCQAHKSLCSKKNVRSYPSIRLYPPGQFSVSTFHEYDGWFRDAPNIRQWIYQFLPSKVKELDANNFNKLVLQSKTPWFVDFHAPWCGHCQMFAPEFERVAQEVEGRAKFGKVNCDKHGNLCQRAGIRAYPTIYFYKGAGKNENFQSLVGDNVHPDANYLLRYLNHHFPKQMLSGQTMETDSDSDDDDDDASFLFHDEL